MNKDDIKKALKMCISSDPCDNCPYKADGRCSDTLKTDALNLIIEQEKEIEQLKVEFKQLETNAEILARGVRDLNHELTEQEEKTNTLKTALQWYMSMYGCKLGRTTDDDYEEYSCNGYVIDKEIAVTLYKAEQESNWFE